MMIMTREINGAGRQRCRPVAEYAAILIGGLMLLFVTLGAAQAQAEWPQVVSSKDGNPISYEVHGAGEPTLVFIHGWSCDARYWREQAPYFSKKHRVITIDLAGHGHSGTSRTQYTMRAFGEDVQAVVEAAVSDRVILIGHSMGGSVIAEAARLMPKRVAGLIGVDTFDNIEYPLTRKAHDEMLAPLEADFRAGARGFVEQMFLPSTDPRLREWILSDMSAAPPAVARGAMTEYLSEFITGEAAKKFKDISIPVVTVNGSLWPVNVEANRRHMASFEAIILKDADHFLMLARPEAFNRALEEAIERVLVLSTLGNKEAVK